MLSEAYCKTEMGGGGGGGLRKRRDKNTIFIFAQ